MGDAGDTDRLVTTSGVDLRRFGTCHDQQPASMVARAEPVGLTGTATVVQLHGRRDPRLRVAV